jgi:hypothetical protein
VSHHPPYLSRPTPTRGRTPSEGLAYPPPSSVIQDSITGVTNVGDPPPTITK